MQALTRTQCAVGKQFGSRSESEVSVRMRTRRVETATKGLIARGFVLKHIFWVNDFIFIFNVFITGWTPKNEGIKHD